MARDKPPQRDDSKTLALRRLGALNPHPQRVLEEAFHTHEFFDPRDRVQVRYEMVRRHRIDRRPVSDVAHSFGVSRQSFYTTDSAFSLEGLAGLLPRRPGPKGAHKCTDEILDFVEKWRAGDASKTGDTVVGAIQREFGVTINVRSIDRAIERRKKNASRRRKRRDH